MLSCASVLALSAAPARAADFFIDGSPLNIYANDAGQLQVAFDGSANGEFFPGNLAPASAGVNVALSTSPPSLTVYGFRGSAPLVADGAPPPLFPAAGLTGNGSANSPYTLRINLTDGAFLHVQEVLTYVNGSTDVGASFQLQAFDNAVTGRLFEAADLYVAGDDRGIGFFDPGPPRQVGGVNQVAGSAARLIQGTPAWTHYQESFYASVYSVIAGSIDVSAPSLSDAVNPSLGDNDLGVQWDFAGLSANDPGQTFSTTWRFTHFVPLALSLVAAAKQQGQIATARVSARNSDGGPDPGRTIRYTINGANPGLGAVTTGANGNATISWTGINQGRDDLLAFTDLNNNGSPDAGEPTQTATVTFGPPPPPVPGKSVVAKVVSGTVLVKYPPGYTPRTAHAAASSGFVPFKGAANLPVGTQLDTKKGRVALTSARDTGGKKTQTSDFYDGIFQVKQALPKKKPKKPAALTTDIVLKGQIARSQCAPLKGARATAVDAKKKKKGPKSTLGKLWGNGKGKFRTTGKYSSATVRGTIWLTQDRCDGTLTKVVRGTVQVRDFKRKKTVTVKAGHSYLARAQRAASKSRRK
jgi:hypothetical protein